MTEKRFTVEKLELVSDHLSTRFFIKDNEEDKYYDVQHIVSVGFEVQYESWADKIAEKMNELNDELGKLTILYSAKCKTEETLIKEGERLEKENKELKRDRNYWKTLAQSLVKKNEKGGFVND